MEQMMSNFPLTWLCLVALFAFIELFFLYYRVIWFSVGATAGLLVSLSSGPFWLQITVAVTVSGLLLWFSRKWVKQVRCDDALQEICAKENEAETDLVRFDQSIGDVDKTGSEFDADPQANFPCCKFPKSNEERGEEADSFPVYEL